MDALDAVVVGGGPAGATAAETLARAGRSVVLLDRAGRIKPCGGAIPPRLVRDFDIPERLLCARIRGARMVAPSGTAVDMPIDGGYVGMVDREVFDEFLRDRAARAGAVRRAGVFERIDRSHGLPEVHFRSAAGPASVRARLVVGADGALSQVARQEVDPEGPRHVYAYHEVLRVPGGETRNYDGQRCDVVYDGAVSPDFYGWVFPHGGTASVGSGSARKGFALRRAVADLRRSSGLEGWETVRHEGAPIPMKPLARWDNGRDVVLAGDAAGVVAPASGEGIYYAMVGGQLAGQVAAEALETGDGRALRQARRRFMQAHGRVFWILGLMQQVWYRSDRRRERFVSICRDPDVQALTWQAYMNKELVRARPAAHLRIFVKDVGHLLGLART